MGILSSIMSALHMAFAMFWEIMWGLILGFSLSAVVQGVVSKSEMSRLLSDDSPKSVLKAAAMGAASSSCSYAAVALARSIFRKGANFTASMVFEISSTNLVIELGIIMIVLMGWQFAAAEFLGAPVMITILVLLFRSFLTGSMVNQAKKQADRGIRAGMEGHAEMDMSVAEGPILKRIVSREGRTAISHYFVMDWISIWKHIVGGLLLAGALAAWVPRDFWNDFFLTSYPVFAKFWGPIVGPLVAIASFVCSIGNVPLAAVLWNGGISFGGVIAFIYADLIVIPILDIYRKYYGWKMMWFILGTFYAAMVGGALVIEFLFQAAGWIPRQRQAQIIEAAVVPNYTTILNILFLMLAVLLLIRFFRTGGPEMIRHMSISPIQNLTNPEFKT